jgi:hypothetical protein
MFRRVVLSRSRAVDAPEVTLITKCWEKDWRALLTGGGSRQLCAGNVRDFAEGVLIVKAEYELPDACVGQGFSDQLLAGQNLRIRLPTTTGFVPCDGTSAIYVGLIPP